MTVGYFVSMVMGRILAKEGRGFIAQPGNFLALSALTVLRILAAVNKQAAASKLYEAVRRKRPVRDVVRGTKPVTTKM
jgi:hypothetical protein